jgi:thiamine biosynthesis lipoprotein
MKVMAQSVCSFAHFAMGTLFELLIAGRDEPYGRQVSQAVFSEIDRIENLFSRFNPCSEISQINRLKPGQSLMVGIETFECLKTAAWVQSQTLGAFDINTGPQAEGKSGPVPEGENLGAGIHILEQIELFRNPQGYALRMRRAKGMKENDPLRLDLGGIGKGYALDKTLDILSDWSISSALVHAGTSTALAIGSAADGDLRKRGWPVGVAGCLSFEPAPKEFILRERALSGSGTEVKGRHILDPRTGQPAKGHLAAWASHPSAALADALSTAFMVMSTEEVKTFCDHNPEVWALVIIDSKTWKTFNDNLIQ